MTIKQKNKYSAIEDEMRALKEKFPHLGDLDEFKSFNTFLQSNDISDKDLEMIKTLLSHLNKDEFQEANKALTYFIDDFEAFEKDHNNKINILNRLQFLSLISALIFTITAVTLLVSGFTIFPPAIFIVPAFVLLSVISGWSFVGIHAGKIASIEDMEIYKSPKDKIRQHSQNLLTFFQKEAKEADSNDQLTQDAGEEEGLDLRNPLIF